jgi:hypothetical protein
MKTPEQRRVDADGVEGISKIMDEFGKGRSIHRNSLPETRKDEAIMSG